MEATGLLVGGHREEDVATQPGDRIGGRIAARGAGLAGEPADDGDLHRDHALHVDGSATPDVAVGDVGAERVVGPQLGRGWDDVEMRQQEERLAAGPVAAQAGGHRAPTGGRLVDRRLDPDIDEGGGHRLGGPKLAIARLGRRVDARDPDQGPEQVDELVVSTCPGRCRDGIRWADRHRQPGPPWNPSRSPMIPIAKLPTTIATIIATSSLR